MSNERKPIYCALVLDEETQKYVKHLAKDYGCPIFNNIKWSPRWIAHHSTIYFGNPKEQSLLEWCKQNEGKEFSFTITHMGISDKAFAAKISTDVPSDNAIKHITLAVNESNNGKPVDSNKITDWNPFTWKNIKTPLTGHIEFVYGNTR